MILEPLRVRADQYDQVAAVISTLFALMDPHINEDTVFDTTYELLHETGGIVGALELQVIAAEANLSKSEVKSKLTH